MSTQHLDRDTLDPVWNDFVESIVLDRVFRRRDALRRRRRYLGAAGSLVVGAAVAVALWEGNVSAPARTTAAAADTAPGTGATLSFDDGSRAALSDDATVFSLNRSDFEVRLAQQAGSVRYSVVDREERSFVVVTLHATLRTRGAVATVAVADATGATTVTVESGTASVKGAEQDVVLSAGESLRLAGAASPAPASFPPATRR